MRWTCRKQVRDREGEDHICNPQAVHVTSLRIPSIARIGQSRNLQKANMSMRRPSWCMCDSLVIHPKHPKKHQGKSSCWSYSHTIAGNFHLLVQCEKTLYTCRLQYHPWCTFLGPFSQPTHPASTYLPPHTSRKQRIRLPRSLDLFRRRISRHINNDTWVF